MRRFTFGGFVERRDGELLLDGASNGRFYVPDEALPEFFAALRSMHPRSFDEATMLGWRPPPLPQPPPVEPLAPVGETIACMFALALFGALVTPTLASYVDLLARERDLPKRKRRRAPKEKGGSR